MTYKFSLQLTFEVLLLLTALAGLSYSVGVQWWYGLLLIPLIVFQCRRLIRINKRVFTEFEQFAESVRYRDFSRRFDTRHVPAHIGELRKGFNDICDVMNAVNREKEIQHQYLQNIIELVDTGIILYREDNGDVLWANRSLKSMLNIPYLKNFNTLEKRNPGLYGRLQVMDKERSMVIPVVVNNNTSKILVANGYFIMEGINYRLIAFRNVNEVLDEAESKAWQRLLNVMTHEIMNSVVPVSSLAGTLKNILIKAKDSPGNPENFIDDIELGVDTIMRRSEGLLAFAETYRNLSKITELNISTIQISNLFEHIYRLMLPSLTQKGIDLEIILKEPLMTAEADASLVEQILINLIVNAIEAVKDKPRPRIILSAALSDGNRPILKVMDNGKGIPDEILDKIFVPFFSTRKNGNGIGLSLCKQIMMLHKGNIRVQTIVGEETCFSLMF